MSWQEGTTEPYAVVGPPSSSPPPAEPGRRRRSTGRPALRNWVVGTLVVIGFALFGMVVAAYYGASFGLVTTFFAIVVAVIPTFLWLDRFEAEPTRDLVTAFLWGALVAAVLAAVFNTGAVIVLRSAGDSTQALAETAVLVAPPVEESLKGLFILLVWRLRRREFDGITDGMVYAGVVAAGFAFTENIQYIAAAYETGDSGVVAATFVGRCLLSPFAHPMFTVLIGIGIGVAASSRSTGVRLFAPIAGWTLAVFAHALWNLSTLAGEQGFLAAYVIVGVPIFVSFVVLVVWARRREARLIGKHLTAYADAGWLTGSEVVMLSSMGRRRDARMWARTTGGRAALGAMRSFQDAASELALLRERMRHSAADAQALETERRLLWELTQWRNQFEGRPAT
jgi:RsiW-degrading membrane proteinase PrsW (M82 family)